MEVQRACLRAWMRFQGRVVLGLLQLSPLCGCRCCCLAPAAVKQTNSVRLSASHPTSQCCSSARHHTSTGSPGAQLQLSAGSKTMPSLSTVGHISPHHVQATLSQKEHANTDTARMCAQAHPTTLPGLTSPQSGCQIVYILHACRGRHRLRLQAHTGTKKSLAWQVQEALWSQDTPKERPAWQCSAHTGITQSTPRML